MTWKKEKLNLRSKICLSKDRKALMIKVTKKTPENLKTNWFSNEWSKIKKLAFKTLGRKFKMDGLKSKVTLWKNSPSGELLIWVWRTLNPLTVLVFDNVFLIGFRFLFSLLFVFMKSICFAYTFFNFFLHKCFLVDPFQK